MGTQSSSQPSVQRKQGKLGAAKRPASAQLGVQRAFNETQKNEARHRRKNGKNAPRHQRARPAQCHANTCKTKTSKKYDAVGDRTCTAMVPAPTTLA